jgi:hypothetical protein
VKFPLDPLLVRFGNDPVSLAEHVGVTPRTVYRWIEWGGVPEEDADRIAVRCGSHPGAVWESWWDVDLSAAEQPDLFELL